MAAPKESQMTSIKIMIIRIAGLGDREVSDWEYKFIRSIVDTINSGVQTTELTGKQVECIERIHDKHFA